MSPLLQAFGFGCREAVKALLAAVKAVDRYGWSTLHFAGVRKEPCSETVHMLVEAEVEVNALNEELREKRRPSTMHTCAWGHPLTLHGGALGGGGGREGSRHAIIHGRSAVHFAAQREEACPQVMQMLVEIGADVKAPDKYGWSAFHYVPEVQEPSPEVMKILVEAGAAVKARNKFQRSPLLEVSRRRDPQAVKALLKAEADVTAVDKASARLSLSVSLSVFLRFGWLLFRSYSALRGTASTSQLPKVRGGPCCSAPSLHRRRQR
uniref:Uncharacterized protein n=1 Tax=Chromera velia CCMP2878 TaxID=1169474 RepID=A0A0G4FMU9_9ALVE|eukprot:Cvel_17648.t1-p1 / transcript=Cvel_17648.t1 / gene=Cvel_17648 / organism=Chromera_velia_CCMP2878 / gene_product=Uveal autoantigen with coiled-coil domains and, putative / transcript_product=Uveal autoantigen with coiled-coil domains and, putative / location=Cvel_scaffold1421:28191-30157(+) / protein_length=264 / sequence_SO=supercontig / SO=protein_coding / is_pseudo=false